MRRTNISVMVVIGLILFSTLAAIEGHHQKDLARLEVKIYKENYEEMKALCLTLTK